MTDVTTAQTTAVARPLKVLIPLIQHDLEQGNEAAKTAGMEYYRAAGEKLIEAKSVMKQGEFTPWIKRHFTISAQTARKYMEYAHATSGAQKEGSPAFSSLNDFHRKTGNKAYRSVTTKRPWHEPVGKAMRDVDAEMENLNRARQAEEKERATERKLALQLIDIGYKVLATKLHPDRGGSRDAMARLNRVRDNLRKQA